MVNINIDFLELLPLEKQQVELVERKGVGHPDSICDGIAESISRALSREYLRRFNVILHHNTDQCELIGGSSRPAYKGGEILKPQYILLGGRATSKAGDDAISVGEIAVETAKKYLRENFREIDVESDFMVDQRIGEGSADLKAVFRRTGMPQSNDTSFGVGYAPLSTLEKLTLDCSNHLNFDCGIKAVGRDVKVMGVRKNHKIILTVACAMISKYLDDIEHYKNTVAQVHDELSDYISRKTDMEVEVAVNTADNFDLGEVYLTVTGLSSEQGDDGSVGRGNRANGLIAPFRPVSLEATAGKNAVNHVGKIYNLLANRIAEDIAKEGAEQVYVRLMSQIGKPINQPLVASVQLIGDRRMESKARELTEYWLEHVTEVKQWCLDGKISVF